MHNQDDSSDSSLSSRGATGSRHRLGHRRTDGRDLALMPVPPRRPSSQTSRPAIWSARYTAFGEHHARAVHAKGVVLKGTFSPDPKARTLTKAPIFAGGPLPMTVRFPTSRASPTSRTPFPKRIPEVSRSRSRPRTAKNSMSSPTASMAFPPPPAMSSPRCCEALVRPAPRRRILAIERFLADHPVAKAFPTTQSRRRCRTRRPPTSV